MRTSETDNRISVRLTKINLDKFLELSTEFKTKSELANHILTYYFKNYARRNPKPTRENR